MSQSQSTLRIDGFAVGDLVKVDDDPADKSPWLITEIKTDDPQHDGPYAILHDLTGAPSWSALRILRHAGAWVVVLTDAIGLSWGSVQDLVDAHGDATIEISIRRGAALPVPHQHGDRWQLPATDPADDVAFRVEMDLADEDGGTAAVEAKLAQAQAMCAGLNAAAVNPPCAPIPLASAPREPGSRRAVATVAELQTFGPYDTEDRTVGEPVPFASRLVPPRSVESRDLALRHLLVACEERGVELGAFDERILTWLAGYEPATVQVIIGVISRVYAAGQRSAVTWDAVQNVRAYILGQGGYVPEQLLLDAFEAAGLPYRPDDRCGTRPAAVPQQPQYAPPTDPGDLPSFATEPTCDHGGVINCPRCPNGGAAR